MAFRISFARLLFTLILSLGGSLCFAQTLALTFDDGLDPGRFPQASRWNEQILASLEQHGIESALFPTRASIETAGGLALVAAWSQAGHFIGNHTASHHSLADSKVSLAQFISDVQKADLAIRKLPTFVPMLRFPYLIEGNTEAKRDGMRSWMSKNGYRNGMVSIDASDWHYSRIYSDHLKAGDQLKAQQLKQAYVRHMLDRAAYYDGLARQVIGRSPAHIMLLHTNHLNADALPELIQALKAHGWAITSASSAFEDPLYRESPDTLPAGESIVWALAKARDLPGLRYPAEGAQYEDPILRSANLLP